MLSHSTTNLQFIQTKAGLLLFCIMLMAYLTECIFDFSTVKECCRGMFDYTAVAEDELNLKKGDVITIINKVCHG